MGRILLLIELKGGNDGLNTVIPYADAKYRELRPGIGVAREHTIQLDEKVGLHNKLEPLMEFVEGGRPRDRAGRRLSLSQPLAFPLDRDLGHRLGLEPDPERRLDRPGLQGRRAAQGRGRRQHRRRHQRAAQHRAGAAHHRHAGRRELPAPGDRAQGHRRHEGRRQSGAAPSAGGAPGDQRRGQGPGRQAARCRGAQGRLSAGGAARPPARSRHARDHGAGAGGGDQGGAGWFRHPCQPGTAARAAAGLPGAEPCDPAQEPDRRQPMERRAW